jgi:hypothetical protein
MRTAIVLVAGLVATQAVAQETSVESMIEMIRTDLRAQKKVIVEKAMNFTEKEANEFWPFYREYEVEGSKLGDIRVAILKDYAANYEKIDDKKADELVKKTIDLQGKRISLMEKYYKKASKFLGMKRAAQWIQVENQLNALLDAKMASETPLLK